MFEEQDTPTGAANPAHFTQSLDRIGECTCAESRYDGVKCSGSESKTAGIHDSHSPCAAMTRLGEHAWAEIDADDIETCRVVVGDIRSSAGGHFEHAPDG
jgi:hypothetical protein